MSKCSYNKAQPLGAKILELISDELDDDDFFACGIAALEMAKTAILKLPELVMADQRNFERE